MPEEAAWYEDEVFWERFRDVVFPPEKFDDASDETTALCALLDLESGASVLDVPCGPGRHAVELAARGFDVTGVDTTQSYLAEARATADERGVDVEFVHGDMREFSREGAFDAVLNLYTSFGYFADRADDERVARNFHDSLRPGGVLCMELTSKELLARDFEARTWHAHADGFVLQERSIEDDWSTFQNHWVVVEDGDIDEVTVSRRLYSAYELTSLLERVGFTDVSTYGDFAGSDFDEDATELVVVAEK